MEFNIRTAELTDLKQLKILESESFDEHIRENFEFVLSSNSHIIFICEKVDGGVKNIVAYAGASISYEQGDILSVCVNKDYRKRGIAYVLMDTLLEVLKESKMFDK